MNVLINGASGYIGYHLTKEMLLAGHTVYAVCRHIGFLIEFEHNRNLNVIFAEQNELADRLKDIKPDVWYQLLWDGHRGEKRADPILQISNEIMYINAINIAESLSCGKIIFTGTVYENFTDKILNDSKFNKHSFYIISKKHARETTFQLSKGMNIEYLWIQLCHPYGKYMNEGQLMPYAIKCFSEDLPTEFGSCENYFDIISVKYLVSSLRSVGEKKTSKSFYYIGSGKPRKLKEYMIEAARICDYKLPIGFGKRPDDGLVFEKQWFDTSDFENEFGLRNTEKIEYIIK